MKEQLQEAVPGGQLPGGRPADVLISAAVVVTMDAQYRLFRPGAVAVTGDSIVEVGPREELLARYDAAEHVALGNAILMPGLVNAHGHAPMVLLRGLVDDLRLDVWLMGYVMPVENEFVTPHFCRLGTQLAAAEMIRSGTTTFHDMYYFEETVAEAAAQAGLRAVCTQSILKFPTPDAASYDEGVARTRDFLTRWRAHPLVVAGIAPHAPYTATPELLEAAVALALEFDAPLHIHVAETAQEVSEQLEAHDMLPVPWLEQWGVFETRATAAHCVHLSESEMSILRRYNVGVAHNPSSNMKLASGIAPVARMLELGLNVGIGTDGAASNNDLDMVEELRLASFLAKVATSNPTALPARQVVEMATVMGARALHVAELTGSLEAGKRADLISLSMERVHHTPQFERDPDSVYARLVYAAHQSDVQDVMVNGVWLMRDRELLTVDVPALRREAEGLAEKVDAFLIRREESILSKLVAIGGVAQERSFEVQVKIAGADLPALEAQARALPELHFVRGSERKQYDTYFMFENQEQSRLRYREDEVLDLESGEFLDVINRLTLTSAAKEREFENSILLSRSRFDARATRSLRFYYEYFQPTCVIEVHKARRRFHVRYQDTEFVLNFDRMLKPSPDRTFLEIKSRTWSRQDAERKAALIGKMLELLQVPPSAQLKVEYLELAQNCEDERFS